MDRRRWRDLGKVGVGLGLLAWLLSSVELEGLRQLSDRGAAAQLWLGLAGLFAGFPVLQAARLHSLIRRYTDGLAGSFKLFFVGALFNNVLPSNVGGDAARLFYLRGRAGEMTTPLLLLLLHRASQLGVLLLAAVVCIALSPRDVALATDQLGLRLGSLAALAWGAAGALLAVAIALVTPPGRRLRMRLVGVGARLREAVGSVTPAMLTELLSWTLAFHGARLFGFHQLCAYFGHDVSLPQLVLVLALTAVAGLLPVTVGGLGVMEGAIVAGLALFAVAAPAALGVALLNRSVLLCNALVGGVVYLVDRERRLEPPSVAGDEAAP